MIRVVVLSSLVVVLATSCGGGGGHSRPAASGGIGGTGIMRGTITEFGSIFVNGVEWDLSDARISTDGSEAAEDDLRLGMVVTVVGRHDSSRGSADSVEFDAEIEGPVEAVGAVSGDPRVREVTVLGRTVRLEEGATLFSSESSAGFGFDSIAIGDVVEVDGFEAGDGSIHATRLEKEGDLQLGTTEVEIKGVIEGFDGVDTFDLGAVSVTFDPTGVQTDLTDLPAGVEDGLVVEVKGVLVANREVSATRIELEDEDDFDDGDDVSIEGLITSFVDLSDFLVAGTPVDASSASLLPDDPDVFGNDIRVEAEGEFRGGKLVARSLELRGGDARIHAAVADDDDVMATQGRLFLLGIPIIVDSSTSMEDDVDETVGFDLSHIGAGDFLEVRGVETDGEIRATRIERREVDRVKLRGRLQAKNAVAGTVTILGVTVPTNGGTEFRDRNDAAFPSAAAFFDAVEIGDVVEAEDDEDGDATSIDVAREVEIED